MHTAKNSFPLIRLAHQFRALIANYLTSLWPVRSGSFSHIHTYCFFVGYSRSGHSLIGSLLDAHPNAVIGHELDSLYYATNGFSEKQIFTLLLKSSEQFTKAGRKWAGYQYLVPNQWNGRFSEIRVIGDKKGQDTTRRFQKQKGLFEELKKKFNVPIKVIHVFRNPYDNISTMHLKAKEQNLIKTIDLYFSLCKTVQEIKQQIPQEDFFEFAIEDFISDPKTYLKSLCFFLGLRPFEDYLNDCASIVFRAPQETRFRIPWPAELIEEVSRRKNAIPYLKKYEYSKDEVPIGSILAGK